MVSIVTYALEAMDDFNTSFSFVLSHSLQTVIEVCALLGKTNIGTLVVSIVTIVGLIIAKQLSALAARKIPIPIPVELITVS